MHSMGAKKNPEVVRGAKTLSHAENWSNSGLTLLVAIFLRVFWTNKSSTNKFTSLPAAFDWLRKKKNYNNPDGPPMVYVFIATVHLE